MTVVPRKRAKQRKAPVPRPLLLLPAVLLLLLLLSQLRSRTPADRKRSQAPVADEHANESAYLPVPRATNASGPLTPIAPPALPPAHLALNARRTLYLLPGRENRCHYQYDYVCKFWFYIRCYVYAAFPDVAVLSLGEAGFHEFTRVAKPGDVAVVVWRSKNHSIEPDLLRMLLRWRDGDRTGGGAGSGDDGGVASFSPPPRVRVGVFHIANEVVRDNWAWYARADFVVRNYWIPDASMPSHATYVPLGHQLPNNCEPWTTAQASHQHLLRDAGACSCGGLAYKMSSRRRHVWHFGGSLRKRRAELLRALRRTRALRARGVVQVARKFGGAGAFGSERGNPKTAYLSAMLEARFVFAPCGNAMETHRIYEALAVGAIPVVEECDAAVSAFFPFRKLLFDGPSAMVAFVRGLADDDAGTDRLQGEVGAWWRRYSGEVAANVSRTVGTHRAAAWRTGVP